MIQLQWCDKSGVTMGGLYVEVKSIIGVQAFSTRTRIHMASGKYFDVKCATIEVLNKIREYKSSSSIS